MKNKILIIALIFFLTEISCKKNEEPVTPVVTVTEQEVLNDFVNVLINPNYIDLQIKANNLKLASLALSTNATTANLLSAQNAWREVRTPWEQSEAYLIGPGVDNDYDPATDTWPVNTAEMDSLLSGNNPLLLSDVDALQFALKGYHPIEYLLFGVGGVKTASQFTPREFLYLNSLCESLYNTVTALVNSWDAAHGNFSAELTTAGHGSTRFSTRKDAFLEIVGAMSGICDEVVTGKIDEPFNLLDSELVESKYAHNATLDFKNNIKGIQNAYMCHYTSTGKSIHDLVAAKNISLDNQLQAKMTAAINSFDAIDPNFGLAIFTQQSQILSAKFTINDLNSSLNLLVDFIHSNIQD